VVRDHNLDERAGSVFQPDTLLASQYFDRVRRRAGVAGERRLMVAVLEDAVTTYMKHAGATDPQRAELFTEAEAWIESDDAVSFYSFENVCAVLDLDPEYLRRGLRASKRRARDAESAERAPDPVDVERRRAS
jgi:hypothetical protein